MNVGRIVFSAFTLAALLGFGYVAASLSGKLIFLTTAEPAMGNVVRLEKRVSEDPEGHTRTYYQPVVRFRTAEGRVVEFTGSTGGSKDIYHRNQQVAVLYDPQAPGTAEIDDFRSLWGMLLFVAAFSLMFGMISLWYWSVSVGWPRYGLWLKFNGRRVDARVVEVTFRHTGPRGRVPTWRIVAQWRDPLSRQKHMFESRTLRVDPQPHLEDGTVPVLIDPKNPKRYALDLSFLPELAG